MEDARTTARWYLCVSMGASRDRLALEMCKAAGATLAVIPEEFPDDVFDLRLVVDTIVGSIVKRRASGHDHGVAIVAEGIAERLTAEQLEHFDSVSRDAYGHVRLADVPLVPCCAMRCASGLKRSEST